jgi:hypothetical protein
VDGIGAASDREQECVVRFLSTLEQLAPICGARIIEQDGEIHALGMTIIHAGCTASIGRITAADLIREAKAMRNAILNTALSDKISGSQTQ